MTELQDSSWKFRNLLFQNSWKRKDLNLNECHFAFTSHNSSYFFARNSKKLHFFNRMTVNYKKFLIKKTISPIWMSHSRNKKRKKRKRSLQDNTSSLKLNSRLVDVHRNFLFTPPFFYPSLFLLPWEYQKKETEKKEKQGTSSGRSVASNGKHTMCLHVP